MLVIVSMVGRSVVSETADYGKGAATYALGRHKNLHKLGREWKPFLLGRMKRANAVLFKVVLYCFHTHIELDAE